MRNQRVLVLCLLFACVAATLGAAAPAAADDGKVIMLRSIPFSDEAFVRPEVRDECKLQTRVVDYILQAANGAQIETVDEFPKTTDARVLDIQIVDTTESGNGFTGRHKSVGLRGELRQNGEVIGSFRARRSTGGGVMGAYKGHCSFFARCAKTLGNDVATWLRNPTMKADLGR